MGAMLANMLGRVGWRMGSARSRLVVFCVGVGGATLGCAADEGPSASDFISEYADSTCNAVAGCCTAAGIAFDQVACTVQIREKLEATAASPNTHYDAAAATDCLAAIAQVAAVCDGGGPVECSGVFAGTLPRGAECTLDAQCAVPHGGFSYCAWDEEDDDTATCIQRFPAPRVLVGLGEECDWSCFAAHGGCDGESSSADGSPVRLCRDSDGLFCSEFGTCSTTSGLGESCETSDECSVGTFCEGEYQCAAQTPLGGPCSKSISCVDGAFCDKDAGICVAGKADGEPCQGSGECASGNCYVAQWDDPSGSCGAPTLANVCASYGG